MAITERELFDGYAATGTTTMPDLPNPCPRRYLADLQPAVDHALRVLLEERIAELWRRRRWYAEHLGWIPAQRTEDMAELRLLVRFVRRARRQAEDAAIAGATWATSYHDFQARGPR